MSSVDQAREEVEKIARDMKKSAQDATSSIRTAANDFKNMTQAKTADYNFGKTVGQLRIGLLVALGLQAITLFMEADRIGLVKFLMPFIMVAGNLFLAGKRWHQEIDGRFDAQQLIQVDDVSIKAQYAMALFGSFFLALAVYFFSPVIPPSITSLVYHLSNYSSIAISFVIVGLEIFEGIRTKMR